MPIYEYTCVACGHNLEALQKISDPPLVDCPACGKPELRKRLTAAAFRLKGTGWYETDFKNADKKKMAKKDPASTDKKGSEGSSSKGDSTTSAAGSKSSGTGAPGSSE